MLDYQDIIKPGVRCQLVNVTAYLKGLYLGERGKRNMERMSERTASDYRSNQHFMSTSPWDARKVMAVTAAKCNARLGDASGQCLSIDESSVSKSGQKSVGVSRQYNGNLGKVDNCQTGVYASLSKGNKVGLVNARLYLPKAWTEDKARCQKAGIPSDERGYKTKPQLASEMIRECVANGIKFGWVNADGLYGQSHAFRNGVADMGLYYVVDVHSDQQVFLSEPKIYLPESPKGKGRRPTKYKAEGQSITVRDYLKALPKQELVQTRIRKGTKGWITAGVHTTTVWTWDGKEEKAREHTLIIRQGGDTKYCLSNWKQGERDTQQFALMQAQRFWIEHAFKECKGELGMADYQFRKHRAWYHHQALVMMAMDFINQEKETFGQDLPLLSLRDVRIQITAKFIEDGQYMEREIKAMYKRHHQRQNDINRYYPDDQ